jgi:hypothetical protein
MKPDKKDRPFAPEVLLFTTKKFGELRHGLEQAPWPDPATIQRGLQNTGRGFRPHGNSLRSNMGPSRFNLRPGPGPGRRPMDMPGGVPRGMRGQAPRVRLGRRMGRPQPDLGGRASGPPNFAGMPDPRLRPYVRREPGMGPRFLRVGPQGYIDPMEETPYYFKDDEDEDEGDDDYLPGYYTAPYGYGGYGGYGRY